MKKTYQVGALLIACLGCITAGVFSSCTSDNDRSTEEKTEYIWQYNKPFASPHDVFMNLDGKLDEDVWKNQTYYEYCDSDYSFRVTTVMTSNGIYIGAEAKDDYVYWELRNNFDLNTNFYFQIVRSDEVGDNKLYSNERLARMATFNIDPYTCRSYRETPFHSATFVESMDGSYNTPNKEVETTGFSVEIFVAWDDLNIEESEKNEYGFRNMKMVCTYRKQYKDRNLGSSAFMPINMQQSRYDTYYEVDETGFKGLNFSETSPFGNTDDGLPATDKWIVDEQAKTATSTVNRTQYIWPTGIDAATNYSIEATIDADIKDNTTLTNSGFITMMREGKGFSNRDGFWNRKMFVANMYNIESANRLSLVVTTLTDGLQYINSDLNDIWATKSETVVANGTYTDNEIKLKLIKKGNYFFYFYNDVLWEIEQAFGGEGKAHTGLFTNGVATFSDVKVEIYDDKEAELDTLLDEISNRVEMSVLTAGGTVTADYDWLPKNKDVTFTINAQLGYYLSKVEEVGDGTRIDITEAVKDGMRGDNKYTYRPTCSTKIEYSFEKFDRLVETPITIMRKDDNGKAILAPGATYVITNKEGSLYYEGTTNGAGRIIGRLPTAGTYDGFGELSGEYTLTVSMSGYYLFQQDFNAQEINDYYLASNKKQIKTYTLEHLPYGSVTVNGGTAVASGTLLYDENAVSELTGEKGLFYVDETGGRLTQFFTDSVSSEFIINVKLKVTSTNGTHVPGIIISPGNASYELKLKRAPWEANNLIIDFGGTIDLSLSGFAASEYEDTDNPDYKYFVSEFTIVCSNKSIYVFDKNGDLGLVIDKNGLHACGGRTFNNQTKLTAISNKIGGIFGTNYKNLAFGMTNTASGCTAIYDVAYKTGEAAQVDIASKLESWVYEEDFVVEGYDVVVDGVKTGSGYVTGMPITLTLTKTTAEYPALILTIIDRDNNAQEIVGVYDKATGSTLFTFDGRDLKQLEVTVPYIEVNITGEVDGVTQAGKVIAQSVTVGEIFETELKADGTFILENIPLGTYDFEFISGNKVAYCIGKEITQEAHTVSCEVMENPYWVSDSITLNGETFTSSNQNGVPHTSTVAQRAEFAGNSDVFTSTYNVALPNTTVRGDENYIYELTIAGGPGGGTNWCYRSFGLGITNGDNTFLVTVRNQYNNYLAIDLFYKNAFGAQTHLYELRSATRDGMTAWDATKENSETTLKFVKTADSLTIYRKGKTTYNPFNIETDYSVMYEIMSDGVVKDASGETLQLLVTPKKWKPFITSLFDESVDHALILASADRVGGFDAKYGFYLTSTYSTFNMYTVSGTVSGVTTAGTVLAEQDGKAYTATLNADGTYAISLPEGEYDFEFVAGDKVAYALNQSVTSSTTVNATAQDGTYRIADSITLNGNTYRASNQNGVTHTSTVEERALFATNNEVFSSAYNVALPNTVAKGNAGYTYELTIAGGCGGGTDWGYRDYGLGITNGNATLMVTVRNQYGTLKIVLTYKDATGKQVAFYDQLSAPQMDGIGGWNATKDQADTTLKFVKTADSLIVYRKGNNTYGGNIHTDYSVMYQIMKDGTIKLANGSTIAMTNQPTDGSWETFIASLFNESKDHALTLASSNIVGGFDAKYGFYLTSTYSTINMCTVSGTVSGVTTAGTVLAEQDGKAYTATLNADGTYAISLPDGEYDFEFVAGDKVAYALNQSVTGATTVNATAIDGTYRIADSITLNGNTYTARNHGGTILPSSTVEQRAKYALNDEVFTELYNVALPNTTVKGNESYVYELKIAGGCGAGSDWCNRSYGLGVTNGADTLMVNIRRNYGSALVIDLVYKQPGYQWNLASISTTTFDGIGSWDATKENSDTTFKFEKTSESLIIYRKGNNTYGGANVHTEYSVMYEILKDGTVKNANGEVITLRTDTVITSDVWKNFVASLFAENIDQALTLASQNVQNGFDSRYGFYLTSTYSKND